MIHRLSENRFRTQFPDCKDPAEKGELELVLDVKLRQLSFKFGSDKLRIIHKEIDFCSKPNKCKLRVSIPVDKKVQFKLVSFGVEHR